MKNKSKRIPQLLTVAVIVGVFGLLAWALLDTGSAGKGNTGAAQVKVPEFSSVAVAGSAAFDANCAKCHGKNGMGSEEGPPFMHGVYNPGHHSDEAFRRAVRQGVRQHHWRFGDMPSQPQVTDRDLAAIVRYVRELQEANGIVYQPHQM